MKKNEATAPVEVHSSVIAEESAHPEPCDTCLRWDECNGVDKDCPLRRV